MVFSPIGEELFYRGIVHGSFVPKTGEHMASIIDSLAFALTHLAHFGIVYIMGNWSFLFVPSLLWVFFMFLTSRLFFLCKVKTGSILGAIASHAGFNLAMMYFILYHIL
jgi:membrane protease YdiL (CAAX protease family)